MKKRKLNLRQKCVFLRPQPGNLTGEQITGQFN